MAGATLATALTAVLLLQLTGMAAAQRQVCGLSRRFSTGAAGETQAAMANRRAGIRAARSLLGRIVLPTGSQPSNSDPEGRLSGPGMCPASGDLIDRHRWWVVPGEPEAVKAFVEANPPPGSRREITGSSSGPNETSWFVGFRWPVQKAVLQSRLLLVDLVALPGGHTAVRADAQVIWTLPKPSSDMIPAAARVMRVMVAGPGERPNIPDESATVAMTVREPQKVARIVAAINRMPLVQPGGWHCPKSRGDAVLTLTFLTSPGGMIVARARMPAWTETEGPCSSLRLALPTLGKTAALDEGSIVSFAEEVLGVPLLTSEERRAAPEPAGPAEEPDGPAEEPAGPAEEPAAP